MRLYYYIYNYIYHYIYNEGKLNAQLPQMSANLFIDLRRAEINILPQQD